MSCFLDRRVVWCGEPMMRRAWLGFWAARPVAGGPGSEGALSGGGGLEERHSEPLGKSADT